MISDRERQVMRLIAEGLTHKELARELGITAGTARRHRDNIRRKMNARNMPHAVAMFVRSERT